MDCVIYFPKNGVMVTAVIENARNVDQAVSHVREQCSPDGATVVAKKNTLEAHEWLERVRQAAEGGYLYDMRPVKVA